MLVSREENSLSHFISSTCFKYNIIFSVRQKKLYDKTKVCNNNDPTKIYGVK